MKRKILGAFAGFLALMLLFTCLSRAADSFSVARVTVQAASRKKITHKVSGSGTVVQNREQAVSTLPNQVVRAIFVEEGQQVAKGDLLFEIDTESLQEQILEKQQEMAIADLQAQDRQSSLEAQADRDARSKSRAQEDYSVAAGKGNTAVARAARELSAAQAKLQALDGGGDEQGEDAVQAVLAQACEQKKVEYELAVDYKEELEQEIDELVRRALAQAGGDAPEQNMPALEANGRETHTAAQTPDAAINAAADAEPIVTADAAPIVITDPALDAATDSAPSSDPASAGTGAGSIQATPTSETASAVQADRQTQPAQEAQTTQQTQPTQQMQVQSTQEEQTTQQMQDAQPTQQMQDAQPMQQAEQPGTEAQTETETQPAPAPGDEDEILVGGEDAPQQAQDPWLLELRIRQENQPLLSEAENQIRQKEQELSDAEAALQAYLQEKASGTQAGKEEMRAQILEEIQAKQEAYSDAVAAAGDGLRAAGRAVEDASAPQGTDSTAQIEAIEKEQRELQLEKLNRLLEDQGKVLSPVDGTVAQINLTTGDRTPDGTAILLADRASGSRLTVQVPKSQEAYIARGDAVTVKTNQKKEIKNLAVDRVRAAGEDDDVLEVTVQLPADSLEAGTFATMESVRSSEAYDCCVPLQALMEENGSYFVYILSRTETVLGEELTAQRLDVTVLEKNETDAALQSGSVGSDQQVIVSSDKMIGQGSRVRVVDE